LLLLRLRDDGDGHGHDGNAEGDPEQGAHWSPTLPNTLL
jgi:hypothetical protein